MVGFLSTLSVLCVIYIIPYVYIHSGSIQSMHDIYIYIYICVCVCVCVSVCMCVCDGTFVLYVYI